jgi:uncharacterized protein YmfQ (DUF2313 family)
MQCGGLSPLPAPCGGKRSRAAVILDALNAALGSAYATDDPNSIIYLENLAIAREIAAAWATNERLGNIAIPRLLTSTLPRWEKILGLSVSPNATPVERRSAVEERFRQIGRASIHAYLTTDLQAKIGDFLVAVEYIDLSVANVHPPDGSYPWGTVVPGYPWYSTVAHVLVRMQKPAGATEAQFQEATGKVIELLDAALPAWNTFDWYRAPTGGAPINVAGGPSAAGFYLDQETNLNHHVFD